MQSLLGSPSPAALRLNSGGYCSPTQAHTFCNLASPSATWNINPLRLADPAATHPTSGRGCYLHPQGALEALIVMAPDSITTESHFTTAQSARWYGILIGATAMMLTIPTETVDATIKLIYATATRTHITCKQLQSLIGRLLHLSTLHSPSTSIHRLPSPHSKASPLLAPSSPMTCLVPPSSVRAGKDRPSPLHNKPGKEIVVDVCLRQVEWGLHHHARPHIRMPG